MIAPDLFTWREDAEAADAVVQAKEAWALALRKLRVAPHGEIQIRQRRVAETAHALLIAEVQLARVRKLGR